MTNKITTHKPNKTNINKNIQYTLKNSGRTVQRTYFLVDGSREMAALEESLSSMEVIFGTDDLAAIKKDMRIVSGYNSKYGSDIDFAVYDFKGLLKALAQDAKEGHLAQGTLFHTSEEIEHRLSIWLFDTDVQNYRTVTVFIYKDCTHTLEFLKDYA